MKNDRKNQKENCDDYMAFSKKRAFTITTIYIVLGAVWVIFSDAAAKYFFKELSETLVFNVVKGLFYVCVTGVIIFLLIHKSMKRLIDAQLEHKSTNDTLQKSNERYKQLFNELNKEKLILQSLIDSVADQIFYKDTELRYIGCNKTYCEFNKKTMEEMLGKNDYEIFGEENSATYYDHDMSVLNSKKQIVVEDHVFMNGIMEYFETIKTPLFDENNECIGLIGVARNINERKEKEQAITYLYYHDTLTGLYNTAYMEKVFDEMIFEQNIPVSLIYGDINGMKIVNDALGHRYGDETIKTVANIISEKCKDTDIAIRTGGDEFIIILNNTGEKAAKRLMDEINHECKKHMADMSNRFYANISLGTATLNSIDGSIYKTMEQAEQSMYKIKLLDYRKQHDSVINAMMETVYNNSTESIDHSKRLVSLVTKAAESLALSQYEIESLEKLSYIHDIGYIGLDMNILKKKDVLDKSEWQKIRQHPEIGFRIIQAVSHISHVSKYVLSHHERWDGKGYPLGLKGEDIPLISRIFAVADAYDAMTEGRPYRVAKTKEQAKRELTEMSGTQFDPDIVKLFIENVI